MTKYYLPIITIICEETLRHGGSIVHHHGIGKARAPWVRDEYGSSYHILETLKHAFDPRRDHEQGDDHPRVSRCGYRAAGSVQPGQQIPRCPTPAAGGASVRQSREGGRAARSQRDRMASRGIAR